jgi:hypothetical protein
MRAEIVAHLGATLALSDETGDSTVGYLIKMALEADHGSSSRDEDRLYSPQHPSVAQYRASHLTPDADIRPYPKSDQSTVKKTKRGGTPSLDQPPNRPLR